MGGMYSISAKLGVVYLHFKIVEISKRSFIYSQLFLHHSSIYLLLYSIQGTPVFISIDFKSLFFFKAITFKKI